ncbi:uncharacterized protein LOC143042275 [Mytilus galloprovincialis]|uniref:uncharacterized protein LOC143042275 n=1 Tax=Mytilus galloprovincialis TaxID=29158 RepID=UPI003F7C49E4
MSSQVDSMFQLPVDFPNIKAEIKQEYAGDPAPAKKRGRKKGSKNQKQTTITDSMPVRKKRDRFNGMPEEEVVKRVLPDHLAPDLDIVIVGINPGLCAAYVGHHYAGPGNHFWKCMFLSGLIPEPLTANDDYKLLNHGIGFTNIVERTTRGSADLSRKEIKEGALLLTEKLQKYKPKIAVFNGKGIYEVFLGHKNFAIGKQPDLLAGTETTVYVMPSSSARCSQLPRAVDKVPFYASLKKLRDYLRGDLKELDDSEVCFPDLELKVVKREPKPEIKEEAADSCSMQSPAYPQNCDSGYPSTNMHIKQEPSFNSQSQYGMPGNGNCSQMQPPYFNSNYSSGQNGNSQYPMMYNSEGHNSQNFQMVQSNMGDNSFQMSQMMMQGQSQNFQMFQGAMQSSFSGDNTGHSFSYQQSLQANGMKSQSTGQVMVQSSFQSQGQPFHNGAHNSQPSSGYQQGMISQGNYMNFPNQHQQNFAQGNFEQNPQPPSGDVSFMGFSQGQPQEGQSNYSQPPSNFVKQEPADYNDPQTGSCNGQKQIDSSQSNNMMNFQNLQGQGYMSQNDVPPMHIKEEPKDFDFTNGSCQSR